MRLRMYMEEFRDDVKRRNIVRVRDICIGY